MTTSTINYDQHNAVAVRNALQRSGGQAVLNSLPLYYSDDDSLARAVRITPGITSSDECRVNSRTFIRLTGR